MTEAIGDQTDGVSRTDSSSAAVVDRDEIRLARFYPLETMADRAFVARILEIATEAVSMYLDAWLPVLGFVATDAPERPARELGTAVAICEALDLLDANRISDLKVLLTLADLGRGKLPFALGGKRSTELIEQLSGLPVLDELAASDSQELHVRVFRLNLGTPRDRLRMAVRFLDSGLHDLVYSAEATAFARFNAKAPTPLARSDALSADDRVYRAALSHFETALQAALEVSRLKGHQPSATSAIFWASLLFTRLCNFSVSLSKLLPGSAYSMGKADEIWDNSSVSSLARDIFECFLLFFYLGVETVPEDEWKARQSLMHLHDCTMRLRVFYVGEAEAVQRAFYEGEQTRLKALLEANTYFASLPEKQRNRLLKGRDLLFLSQDEILERLGEDRALIRRIYEMLSAHTHSLPLSFYSGREDDRGRGVENLPEKRYMAQSLEFLTRILARATTAYLSVFPETGDQVANEA